MCPRKLEEESSLGAGKSRRRAEVACTACRQRKVRCDVAISEDPCSNCTFFGRACFVRERQRKRFVMQPGQTEYKAALPDEPEFTNTCQLSSEQRSLAPDMDILNAILQDIPPNFSQTEYGSSGHHDKAIDLGDTNNESGIHNNSFPSLPSYIRNPPRSIDNMDVETLIQCGVFHLPSSELIMEFLSNYVQFIHPLLPLLDLEDLVGPIVKNDGSLQISFLLFYAVMFAGATFSEIHLLQGNGYVSAKAVRRELFQKVKVLYETGYETDQLAICQSLLLLSLWYDKPTDADGSWFWLEASLSKARALRLNCDPEAMKIRGKEKHLRRRFWWCCFIRDRLIAMSTRHPLQIKEEEFDVKLPNLNDFGSRNFSIDLSMLDSRLSKRDECFQKAIFDLWIKKIKLCYLIGRVMLIQYRLTPPDSLAENPHLQLNLPCPGDSISVISLGLELESFGRDLPSLLQKEPADSLDVTMSVHIVTLRMIYWTALSALYRPEISNLTSPEVVGSRANTISQEKVILATVEIANIGQHIQKKGLTRFLPPIGVTALLPAILTQSMQERLKPVDICNTQRLCLCVHILQELRGTYSSADSATLFLQEIWHQANLKCFDKEKPSHLPFSFRTELDHFDVSLENFSNTGDENDCTHEDRIQSTLPLHGSTCHILTTFSESLLPDHDYTQFEANWLDYEGF